MGTLTWTLSDPDLGLLERLGVGGMALAIDAAAQLGASLAPLQARFDRRCVELAWPDDVTDEEALMSLVDFAWQARKAPGRNETEEGLGVLYFPGIHRGSARDDFTQRLVEHGGVLSTFLQQSKPQPKTKPREVEVQLDEDKRLSVRYVEPKSYLRYPRGAREQLFEKGRKTKGRLRRKEIRFASYLVPGATARHQGEKSWTGSARQALALLFAPTAAFYLKLHGAEWVIVSPDVRDLRGFVTVRTQVGLGLESAEARTVADAGLLVLVALKLGWAATGLEAAQGADLECEVAQVGRVAWNRNQRVRKARLRFRVSREALGQFEVVERHMPNRFQPREDAPGFVSVPRPRAVVAQNLAAGTYWYAGLFAPPAHEREALERQRKKRVEAARRRGEHEVISLERLWFEELARFHRKELRSIMTELPPVADIDEHFVEVVHQALRQLYAKEAEAAKRGTRSAADRIEDLDETLRRELMRAQTRPLLRETLTRMFARAGRSAALQKHGHAIWRLIDDPLEWRRARDLALLALATYARSPAEQSKVSADDSDSEAVAK